MIEFVKQIQFEPDYDYNEKVKEWFREFIKKPGLDKAFSFLEHRISSFQRKIG